MTGLILSSPASHRIHLGNITETVIADERIQFCTQGIRVFGS